MAAGGSWSDYTYDPPFDTTLVNLPGIRDAQALALVEKFTVALRVRDLRAGDIAYPAYGDVESIRNLHLALYQDLYGHAGEYRTVNMSKQWPPELGRGYTDFLATERIGPYLDELGTRVRAADWSTMDRDEFAQAAADVFSRANFAHPFREGNGRSTKVFMEHVAEQSRFTLDFAQITPEVWNRASVLTSPDPGSDVPVPDAMVSVFRAAAAERTRRSTRGVDPAARSRSPLSASYPRSPRQAPGRAPGEPQQHPYRGPSGYGPHDKGMAR